MAEECTATSSSIPINWWADVHASSWSTNTTTNNNTNTWNPTNPNSNSSCEDHDDVSISNSFTNNASNHSGLSIDSSRRFATNNNGLIGSETASDHQLWNRVLLNVESNGGLQNGQDVGDNLINTYPPKNLPTGLIFDPACDYLKKMDSGWEFSSSPAFNNFDKNFNGFNNETIFENGRLSKLSNLVSNWSIAPPEPEMNHQFGRQPCNISLSSSTVDHQFPQSTVTDGNINGLHSSYGHNETMKVEPLIRRLMINDGNGVGYQTGANSMNMGDNVKYYNNFPEMSYASCLSKQFPDVTASKSILKSNLNLSDCRKQSLQTSYPKFQTISSPCNTVSRSGRKGQLSNGNEGKKKRSDYQDNSDTNSKKPKHDTASASVSKANVPKAKVAEKITALQQIVSPFGKTDTASVLWEAISYIKFLQEQVEQCLNNPYMKNNSIKDPWGVDLKNIGEEKFDLKNRGLCLVPISRTPQVYRENSGSDFWTPAYRGCLYR